MPQEARLKRMRDVLRHSLEGEGLWIEGRIDLNHRRLFILDVAGGHQPTSNEDGAV
jgi:asparagine synthetase B (glutamine-hydrolysing)